MAILLLTVDPQLWVELTIQVDTLEQLALIYHQTYHSIATYHLPAPQCLPDLQPKRAKIISTIILLPKIRNESIILY